MCKCQGLRAKDDDWGDQDETSTHNTKTEFSGREDDADFNPSDDADDSDDFGDYDGDDDTPDDGQDDFGDDD